VSPRLTSSSFLLILDLPTTVREAIERAVPSSSSPSTSTFGVYAVSQKNASSVTLGNRPRSSTKSSGLSQAVSSRRSSNPSVHSPFPSFHPSSQSRSNLHHSANSSSQGHHPTPSSASPTQGEHRPSSDNAVHQNASFSTYTMSRNSSSSLRNNTNSASSRSNESTPSQHYSNLSFSKPSTISPFSFGRRPSAHLRENTTFRRDNKAVDAPDNAISDEDESEKREFDAILRAGSTLKVSLTPVAARVRLPFFLSHYSLGAYVNTSGVNGD
jgi:hypothetical protein